MREGDGAGERSSGDGQTSRARAVRGQTAILWTLALDRRLPGALPLGRRRPGVILDCGRHE
eukprot:8716471-Pyramimonas_sp.AAC.1